MIVLFNGLNLSELCQVSFDLQCECVISLIKRKIVELLGLLFFLPLHEIFLFGLLQIT